VRSTVCVAAHRLAAAPRLNMRLTADGNPAIDQMATDDLVVIQVDRQPFELLVLVPAWMSSDCCRSRRGFEPHDL